jgi:hypothetical protein
MKCSRREDGKSPQKKIEEIFDKARNQAEALNEIYRLFIPNWYGVKRLAGWPACGKRLNRFILDKFIVFDFEKHPGTLAGGLWLSRGFSEDPALEPWEVDLSRCQFTYEEKPCFT